MLWVFLLLTLDVYWPTSASVKALLVDLICNQYANKISFLSHVYFITKRGCICQSFFQSSSCAWIFLQDMTATALFLYFWWAGSSLNTTGNKFLSNFRIKSCFLNEIFFTRKYFIALSLLCHLCFTCSSDALLSQILSFSKYLAVTRFLLGLVLSSHVFFPCYAIPFNS